MPTHLFKLLPISVIIAIVTSGCIVIDVNGSGPGTVRGSGNVIAETRRVDDFNEIRLKGQGKVTLVKGAAQSLEVRTDDNIMPNIETVVESGQLLIAYAKKNLKPTTLHIYITVKELRGLSIAGSGDINGQSVFVAQDFYAEISGSGNIHIELQTAQMESDISGSGCIYLSGRTEHHRASITGSGKIDAFDMQAKQAFVSITGSGDCRLTVSEKLRAKITGSGDVFYKGYPQISKMITGSGKVQDHN